MKSAQGWRLMEKFLSRGGIFRKKLCPTPGEITSAWGGGCRKELKGPLLRNTSSEDYDLLTSKKHFKWCELIQKYVISSKKSTRGWGLLEKFLARGWGHSEKNRVPPPGISPLPGGVGKNWRVHKNVEPKLKIQYSYKKVCNYILDQPSGK